MNENQQSLLLQSAARFPPPKGVKLSYGTAGFRADASLLEATVFRVGILAALRSLKAGSVIGLMITASHNQVSDNGVKVADPSGGMLTQDWEPFADAIANAPDPHSLLQLITEFMKKEDISLEGRQPAEVLLGRDTRPSGEALLEAAKQGITSIVGAIATDMGVVTTPQLHWMVRARNRGMEASESSYFHQLSSSFRCLMDLKPEGSRNNGDDDTLVVDGADGVGGEKLEHFKKMLTGLCIEVRNRGDGMLNEGVGADYVQKEKVAPRGFGPAEAGLRCASLDGDADRLVYFSVILNKNNKIELVDGDKILSLFALFIKDQLSILNEGEGKKENGSYQARLGVVQTAYANGASTDYLKEMGLEVVLTPTGVKYLHEKAAEFDIGIYFEANGHGTILFSEVYLSWLEATHKTLLSTSEGSAKQKAASRLLAVSQLINQAVGDAISGLLLVEVILQYTGWSIKRWNELYHDLPSRQLKVKVVDRTAVVTANAETVAVQPIGIQEAINAEIAKYPRGRCFIRPSGTEDVVRVYAEATTQDAADALASSVATLVNQYLGSGTA
ncbi:phosphoacetylglucosamine mutase isoform X1 [Lycium ferocissimum]|uniref:phosphoacetylglucosamine mutase isoform X1 n=1 Tax=Lycium ferocissimum TaxID=112874 RepID=UPI002814ED6E|nr:phosphoacetylglucosamine mutase isoform X1 [Lycium ferocissimum]